jgi:hypothetical protein
VNFEMALPSQKVVPGAAKSRYAWTTGNDESIAHQQLIGKGGYGEVHKVPSHLFVWVAN